MIYRLFGDKQGMVDAVAEHGFRTSLFKPAVVSGAASPLPARLAS